MKRYLSIIFFVYSAVASATDYYISSSGDDVNNSGLSTSMPWKTIAKVNSVVPSLKPGDRILFKRGDIFYGTINITKSGVAGSPITVGSYGTGAKPIITGLTTSVSWTNEGNGIYSTTLSSESKTNMVIIDGVQYGMGRFPDAGTNLIFESHTSSPKTITDKGIGSIINWRGAELVINKWDWILDRCSIIDHTGDVFTYSDLGSTMDPYDGRYYFIQNDLRCVTTVNEWYHAFTDGKFYLYGDPSSSEVKIATLNNIISLSNHQYITIDGLALYGSISNIINSAYGSYITIKNCDIAFSGNTGITLKSSNSVIDGNSIINCNGDGVYVEANMIKIENNTISNIGLIPGQVTYGTYTQGIRTSGSFGNTYNINYNNIQNVSYNGIGLSSGQNQTVRYNFINNACKVLDDGGGIYSSGTSQFTRTIEYNIILNSGSGNSLADIARGIYLDEKSSGCTVRYNTCSGCLEGGIMLHHAYSNNVSYNTSFNNGQQMYLQAAAGTIYNNIFEHNILISRVNSQLCLKAVSTANDIQKFGNFNYNYYARPTDDGNVIFNYAPSIGYIFRTLSSWQIFANQDLNSQKSPVSLTDAAGIAFYYNATKSDKVIPLSEPMIDVTSKKYSNSITLLPYTSIILFVDPNPSQSELPAYSNSNIEGSAPSILIMTFNESLANVIPAPTAFTVNVNGTNRSINSVSISGNKIWLTLSNPVVYGDEVTVAYVKPDANSLKTSSGGIIASITAQPVRNECTSIANYPPIVNISAPIKGGSYTAPATITIDAVASDSDGTVSKVEFYQGTVLLGERTESPYSFTWKEVTEGTYSLTAVAIDNTNLKTTSPPVSVVVEKSATVVNQIPAVTISNPNAGKKFNKHDNIVIEATASDPDGTISKVEFKCGEVTLAEVKTSPYSYIWQDADTGTYLITAIAIDNLGARSASSNLEFTVGILYDPNSEVINLYPNPNDGHFSINFTSPLDVEYYTITIVNLIGNTVYREELSKEERTRQFDLSHLNPGTYVVVISTKEIILTQKFIKG